MFTAVVYKKRAINLFKNKLLTKVNKVPWVLCKIGAYRDFELQVFAGFKQNTPFLYFVAAMEGHTKFALRKANCHLG